MRSQIIKSLHQEEDGAKRRYDISLQTEYKKEIS